MKRVITFLVLILLSTVVSVSVAKDKRFCSSQILAKETKTGFTWTLTSRLSDVLQNAEQRYGKRDQSWTILGIEFSHQKQPAIWYPSVKDGRKHLIIQLTETTANDKKQALYQLAHEVIHVLSPSGEQGSTVFEEGLAVYFAINYLKSLNYKLNARYISGQKFKKAYQLVNNLYERFKHPEIRIKRLRKQVKKTSDITADQFTMAFSGLNKATAKQLATPFSSWQF
ncbi:MAG: hypothetical protein KAG28_06640 [Cocleimonas sp.]|nr:hypothetical protein [Cocleimonas sp.]